jgi:hypothetical protein
MLPLYAARIEDLGQSDFVKVDSAACHHVALDAGDPPFAASRRMPDAHTSKDFAISLSVAHPVAMVLHSSLPMACGRARRYRAGRAVIVIGLPAS